MKKLLFLLAISLSGLAMAQTPIATRSIGIDSTTNLDRRINVWRVTIDAKTETVTVVYDIETLAPTGVVVAVIENKIYTRLNIAGDMRFNALRSSQVGQMIAGMIANDLSKWPNLDQ